MTNDQWKMTNKDGVLTRGCIGHWSFSIGHFP